MPDPLVIHLNTERLRRGWTTKLWADTAGVHQQTVQKIIRGDVQGMVWVIRLLAAALGLELWIRPKNDAAA